MHITWLDINASYAHSSLALPLLHAATEATKECKETTWSVVHGTLGDNTQQLVDRLYAQSPDIIAATAWLFVHEKLIHILTRIKALLPHCIVITGGPEYLGNNETLLRSVPAINCVVRGEGEEMFPQWLSVCRSPEAWTRIPGLCFLNGKGEYIDNGTATVTNVANLPRASTSRFFSYEKPFIQIESVRGCFNGCIFCVSGNDHLLRPYPLSEIACELDQAVAHGVKEIRLLDRTFNYSLKHTLSLLDLMEKYAGRLSFHVEIHPGILPYTLRQRLALLSEGVLHVEAGIQSLREEVLQACRRKGNLTKCIEGIAFLASLPQIETHTDLIAGLPHYPLQALMEDVIVLSRLDVAEIQLELLKVLPGTPLRSQASELNIVYAPLPPYEVLETQVMTPDELLTARHLSRLLDLYYNLHSAWREVMQQLLQAGSETIRHFIAYATTQVDIHQPLSQERRGMLLYAYVTAHHPSLVATVAIAWVRAGLSLKRTPATHFALIRELPPIHTTSLRGNPNTAYTFYALQATTYIYYIGYDRTKHITAPQYEGIYRRE